MTFTKGKTYPSAVKGVKFCISSIHQVQDTICMVVFRVNLSTLFGRTSQYYLALVEEDGKTATVLLDEGFTTIYDEEEKE